jgi:hypothetical protein
MTFKHYMVISVISCGLVPSLSHGQRGEPCPREDEVCEQFCADGRMPALPPECIAPRCDCGRAPEPPREEEPPREQPDDAPRVPGLTFTYSGFLRDAAERPVNEAKSLAFALYATSTGGDASWSEDHDAVPVREGHVTVA